MPNPCPDARVLSMADVESIGFGMIGDSTLYQHDCDLDDYQGAWDDAAAEFVRRLRLRATSRLSDSAIAVEGAAGKIQREIEP